MFSLFYCLHARAFWFSFQQNIVTILINTIFRSATLIRGEALVRGNTLTAESLQLFSQKASYTSAIQIIRNKTKFEHTKEYFISQCLLNICKLNIFSLNTTVSLQIAVVQKQLFQFFLGFFKGFLICISNRSSVIKSIVKNPGEINLSKAHNLVYVLS